MFNLVGKWKLSKNEEFDNFLKYTKIPWYQRKIARYCKVLTSIKQINENEFLKEATATFYKMDPENIDFTKDEWIKSGTTKKKYSRDGDVINVEVKGSMVDWNEKIYYQDPNMIVEYHWLNGGFAKQIFTKLS